jgi:hypothetical protein
MIKFHRFHEIAVVLPKPGTREFRSTAKLLELKEDGAWALLRIPPQNITEVAVEFVIC